MRAIPVFILAGLLLLVALAYSLSNRGRVRSDDPHRYRPRQRHDKAGTAFADDPAPDTETGPTDDAPTDFVTGAALDPDAGIVRCNDCRALYHPDTAALLVEHNGCRCASCGGTSLQPLAQPRRWRQHGAPRRDRALVPEPTTAQAYEAALGRLATIEADVLHEMPSRRGWPALLMRDASGVELRLVLVGDVARSARGRALALGLLGSRVRARGLLNRDEALGLRLLVLDPAMVVEVAR